MKTIQVMETIDREFLGHIVKQRTDAYFSLKGLCYIGNKQRELEGKTPALVSNYFNQDNTKEFMQEIEKKFGVKAKITGRGRNADSWLHPLLFIDMALWFSAKAKVELYSWLLDYLIEYRVKSSDSYVRMCGILYKYANNKEHFQRHIKVCANSIKELIGVDDWNKATQDQLRDREYLQNMIADLSEAMCSSREGYRLAIKSYEKRRENVKEN